VVCLFQTSLLLVSPKTIYNARLGDNCGASYLNENFKNLLENRLRQESYLFQNGETLESIVNRLIPQFEDVIKRRVDVTRPCGDKIYVARLRSDEAQGLRGPDAKRFESNKLIMHKSVSLRVIKCYDLLF